MSSITLKQLAELSGLSVRTVSRVLKGEEHVVPEKRDMILALAQEHNYIPNMAARNLRLNRTNFVGIICTDLGKEVFVKKLHDLETQLEACGYYPLIGRLVFDPAKVRHMLTEWAGITDHVVVMPTITEGMTQELVDLFRQFPLNVIFVDQKGVDDCHTLTIDRVTGIRSAISHLIKSGRKKILRCGNISTRDQGLLAAFEDIAHSERPELLRINCVPEFETGRSLGPEIMQSGADAVFFDTDRMALGFMNYAAANRIAIPEQIAVVGFDDDSSGKMIYPSLSTVAHPIEELNREIISIIRSGGSGGIVKKSFATRFIRRDSV